MNGLRIEVFREKPFLRLDGWPALNMTCTALSRPEPLTIGKGQRRTLSNARADPVESESHIVQKVTSGYMRIPGGDAAIRLNQTLLFYRLVGLSFDPASRFGSEFSKRSLL